MRVKDSCAIQVGDCESSTSKSAVASSSPCGLCVTPTACQVCALSPETRGERSRRSGKNTASALSKSTVYSIGKLVSSCTETKGQLAGLNEQLQVQQSEIACADSIDLAKRGVSRGVSANNGQFARRTRTSAADIATCFEGKRTI